MTGPRDPAAPSEIHWELYPGETCHGCHTPIVMSYTKGWVARADLTVNCPKSVMGHGGGGPRIGQLTLF